MEKFGRFYLDNEKDIIVDLYKEDDRLYYVLSTPNHHSGNLITNLAKLCQLPISYDDNGLKIIRGEVPCYIDSRNREIYIFRLANTKVANIFPDGSVEMKAAIPALPKTLMSQTKEYTLDANKTIIKTYIIRDYKLKINHQLLVKPGTKLEDIKEIYSHNQAIGQCSQFLKEHPNIKINIVQNTAVAARMVADSERNDIAAISSSDCRQLYGLDSIQVKIQNTDHNYTRFICITKDLRIYPGASKTSIMLALGHKPGALADTLAKFSSLELNLTKIESRPIAGSDFEFMFYLDFEASAYSDEVVKLLCQLDSEPSEFTYLGTYI